MGSADGAGDPAGADLGRYLENPAIRIAMRAYEKWAARGCPEGTELRDWLEAEAELRHAGGLARQLEEAESRLAGYEVRRRQAEALSREQDLSRAVIEGTTDAVFVKDLQGRYLMINPAGARYLGKTVEEVIGKTDLELFEPESARRLIEDDRAIMASGRMQTREERVEAIGEVPRIYLATKGPYRDPQGQVIGLIGISRDITERTRAGEASARLAAIVESTHDAIIGMAPDGAIVAWNPAAERLYGYGAAEIVGHPFTLLIPQDRREEELRAFERARRGGTLDGHESVRVRRDGRRVEVSVTLSPIRDAAGAITGVSSIIRDVTRQKQAERRQATEHAVAAVLAESAGIEDIAPGILRALGEGLGWEAGVLWVPDPDAGVLCGAGMWHAEGLDLPEFERLSRCFAFPRGVALPGRVWETGRPIWGANHDWEDAADADLIRLAAVLGGLRGVSGFPARHNGETCGVLEFFGREPRPSDHDLLRMMARVGEQLCRFIQQRETERALRERQKELGLAREIQQGLLPCAAPELPGLAIAGKSWSAQVVGGDYFDYLPMRDGRLGIAIGDACGHGVAAALLMAQVRAYLHALARTQDDVGTILTMINAHLAEGRSPEHFVTLLLVRLDPATRRLEYAGAGHWPGYLLDRDGRPRASLASEGLPLGVAPDTRYETAPALTLGPGELLFACTDGLVEARVSASEMFGIRRALDILRARRREPPDRILERLSRAARAYDTAIEDDITLVVARLDEPG